MIYSAHLARAAFPRQHAVGSGAAGVLLAALAFSACTDGSLAPARCPELLRLCGPADIGECHRGRQLCNTATGEWGPCEGASWGDGAEVCDGKDNDCDGLTDNATPRPCGEAAGDCGPPETACADGVEVCRAPVPPTPESCDGRDNDCDGETDEGLYVPCYSGAPATLGRGPCAPGVRPCGSAACFFEVLPAPEVCDGLDNDCDGETDEGSTETPGCCAPPEPEVCDGLDNDCDGAIDEGLTWTCDGLTYCVGEGPEEIPCNGLDDDCDGRADEGDRPWIEVAIAVDVSGSNLGGLANQRPALETAVTDFSAIACATYTVAQFPADAPAALVYLAADVDAAGAVSAIQNIASGGSTDEWSYDVLALLAAPADPGRVRSIVLIADEGGQSSGNRYVAEQAAFDAVTGAGTEVLTFTGLPRDYAPFGPTRALNADIASEMFEFLRQRAGL